MNKSYITKKFPSTIGCKVQGCSKKHDARGYCNTHYAFLLRNNKLPPKVTLNEKFWERVVKSDDCWNWVGTINPTTGYGNIRHQNKLYSAHRLSLIVNQIQIKPNLVIDHLCKNRKCVNPKHLEQVTLAENTLRGNGAPALNKRKTECKFGHPFNKENTIFTKKQRQCKICKKIKSKIYRLSLKNKDRLLPQQS